MNFEKLVSTLGLVLGTASVCVMFSVAASAQEHHNTLTFEDGEEGWMLLFYGSTLDDWTPSGEAEWRVENGALVSDSQGRGLLLTVDEYGNFEMVVDFLAEPGANSGIFLRTTRDPKDMAKDCYELNIAPPDHAYPTGSLVAREKVEGVGELDDWRQFHVEAYGGEITVKLDGEVILQYEDPDPIPKGYIGLQHNQGRIEFRNVKIRHL